MQKFRYFLTGTLFPFLLFALSAGGIVLLFLLRLPPFVTASWAVERVFSLCVAASLSSRAGFGEEKFARALFVLLLPWVGAIACLLFGKSSAPSKANAPSAQFDDELLARCARVTGSCQLSAGYAREVKYFSQGRELLPALLNDLSGARKFIYLEFYLIASGAFRDSVLTVLERQARAGVKVRLIYDDLGCALTLPRGYYKQLRKMGIEAKPAQRVSPFSPRSANLRDHRKLVVIDGVTAYTGGVNLADEYVGEHIRFGHWKDAAIRIKGSVCAQFTALFEERWAEDGNLFVPLASPSSNENTPCIPFGVRPREGRSGAYYKLLLTLLPHAEKRAYLTTPYLAPTEELLGALALLRESGTDVKILIPHRPDKKSVFLLTRDFARRLEKIGVCVREYEAGFLHAKTVAIDGKYAVISSCNLDMRSLNLQYECGALVADEAISNEVERDFLNMWEQSVPVPKPTAWGKIFTVILRPFAHFI